MVRNFGWAFPDVHSFSRLLKPFISSSQAQLSHLHLISCNSSRVVATCLKTMAIEKSSPRCKFGAKAGTWPRNLDTTVWDCVRFPCTWEAGGVEGACPTIRHIRNRLHASKITRLLAHTFFGMRRFFVWIVYFLSKSIERFPVNFWW